LQLELKNSPNFVHTYKMEEHKYHSTGGLTDPCAFSTKPAHPPRSSNTQGPSRAHLSFLWAILGRKKDSGESFEGHEFAQATAGFSLRSFKDIKGNIWQILSYIKEVQPVDGALAPKLKNTWVAD